MAFVEMANQLAGAADEAGIGMDGLMKLQAYYYEQFYSATERATKAMQDLLKGINKEWPTLKDKLLGINQVDKIKIEIPALKALPPVKLEIPEVRKLLQDPALDDQLSRLTLPARQQLYTGQWQAKLNNQANAEAALRAAEMYLRGINNGTLSQNADTEAKLTAALNSYGDELKAMGIDIGQGLASVDDQLASIGKTFMTAADRQSLTIDPNADIYAQLVNDMPKSRDEFEKLIGQIDLTSESGRLLYAEIMKLVPAFDAMYDSIEGFEKWLGVTDETALATKRLEKVFADLGLDMPASKNALLELYNAGKLTADMMAMLGVNLDDLALVFKDTADDLTDLFADQRATLLDMAEQLSPTNATAREQVAQAEAALRTAGYTGDMRDAAGIADFLRALAAMDDAGGEAAKDLLKFFDTFTGVFEALAAAAEERAGLTLRLAEVSGDEALVRRLQRERELAAALDDTNRAILYQIYAWEDGRRALDEAYTALERAVAAEREQVQATYEARVAAIAAEREAVDAAHNARLAAINAEREAVQAQLQAGQEAVTRVSGVVSAIQSALSASRGQAQVATLALAAARRQLADWAGSGFLPDQESFERATAPLGTDDRNNYATELAYRAAQQATYGNLLILEQLGLSQKSDAELQLAELETQTQRLDDLLEQEDRHYQEQIQAIDEQLQQANDWRDAELKRLDDILADAKQRLEIALGTYQETISIKDALHLLNENLFGYSRIGAPPDEVIRGWDPVRDQLITANATQSAQASNQTAAVQSLDANLAQLRQEMATIGMTQANLLKALDDRLMRWDLDGSPPWRDDGTGQAITVLKVA
jgi:hypothetical protein